MLINISIIMLAYASVYEITYYAGNYASIIGQPLQQNNNIKGSGESINIGI